MAVFGTARAKANLAANLTLDKRDRNQDGQGTCAVQLRMGQESRAWISEVRSTLYSSVGEVEVFPGDLILLQENHGNTALYAFRQRHLQLESSNGCLHLIGFVK